MVSKKKKKKKQFKFAHAREPKRAKYKIAVGKVGFYEVHPYFSFRYYHIDHNKFTHKGFTGNDFDTFFRRMQQMCQYTWKEILVDKKRFFHVHKVAWNETEQKSGFAHLNETLRESPAYQFEIFKECRIFGFFNHDNVFKIVWIDRHHEIYSQR